MRRLAGLALIVVVSACGPKSAAPPLVSAPKFPEFLAPVVPEAFAGTSAATHQAVGWQWLQSGDFGAAQREFAAAASVAGFYPADTALGYVELAKNDPKGGLVRFDRVLAREPRDVSALVGRAQALEALNRDAEAIAAFEAAVAVDASLTDASRHLELLRFHGEQEIVVRARQAARAGQLDDAIAAYSRAIGSSPDSAFLYREVAAVERQRGRDDRALEHLRTAAQLDAGDARSLVQIGEILDSKGDYAGALDAYGRALAIDPDPLVEARRDKTRARAALAILPAEYRAIGGSTEATRGELAALIGVRLGALLQGRRRDGIVITDIRNHWAEPWILAVARAGLMEPFDNHAFQPGAVIHRADLAQVVSRLLVRMAEVNSRQSAWQDARLRFADIGPAHLAYRAASAAVASGVMAMGDAGGFQPSRVVTGAEAMEAIGRVEAMQLAPARTR